MVHKIISGGQTGVDRAALDVARTHDIPHGGWCPRGRRAEDGEIPDYYMLSETPLEDYSQRTEWNVRDSDGTLIVTRGEVSGGTALTIDLARQYDRPLFVYDLERDASAPGDIKQWMVDAGIHVLNVAGPRSSEVESIYDDAFELLSEIVVEEGSA
jgi:hypothetical protein